MCAQIPFFDGSCNQTPLHTECSCPHTSRVCLVRMPRRSVHRPKRSIIKPRRFSAADKAFRISKGQLCCRVGLQNRLFLASIAVWVVEVNNRSGFIPPERKNSGWSQEIIIGYELQGVEIDDARRLWIAGDTRRNWIFPYNIYVLSDGDGKVLRSLTRCFWVLCVQ